MISQAFSQYENRNNCRKSNPKGNCTKTIPASAPLLIPELGELRITVTYKKYENNRKIVINMTCS